MTPATLVTPVPWRPLPEKAFRRRKAGRYSVKKSALFERSEFADFRNIAWLFQPVHGDGDYIYSYESRSLAEQVSVLAALGLDFLATFVDDDKSSTPLLAFQNHLTSAKPKDHVRGFSYLQITRFSKNRVKSPRPV